MSTRKFLKSQIKLAKENTKHLTRREQDILRKVLRNNVNKDKNDG